MTRQITIEEVKKHKHKSSVWMIIHNDVYDVTSFLEEHPGGEESLTAFAGKDGTQVFEDVNHSEDARELMKKYKIGTLPPEQHNRNIDNCCNTKLRRRTSFGSQKSRCSICSAPSCSHLPKMLKSEKSWRTFDGGSSFSRTEAIKSDSKKNVFEPKSERRVGTIVVPPQSKLPPRYNRPKRFPCEEGPTEVPCEGGYNYKWVLLALAGVLVLGFVFKKYLAR